MNPIAQLDTNLINKIAAGEVVERPLSVIKELVENAIDSGAASITVEITGGGLDMMRITDNGSGIMKESLPLVFSRHATSKIKNFDDLMRVKTMGFRGEALSSISSVAQVELITKTPYDAMGTRTIIHGGKHVLTEEIGATDPSKALPYTIRGAFGLVKGDVMYNCVHASGTPEEARREISLWFKPEEIVQ